MIFLHYHVCTRPKKKNKSDKEEKQILYLEKWKKEKRMKNEEEIIITNPVQEKN